MIKTLTSRNVLIAVIVALSLAIVALASSPYFAADREERLIRAAIAAQLNVNRAIRSNDVAAKALNDYCGARAMNAMITGCVAKPSK